MKNRFKDRVKETATIKLKNDIIEEIFSNAESDIQDISFKEKVLNATKNYSVKDKLNKIFNDNKEDILKEIQNDIFEGSLKIKQDENKNGSLYHYVDFKQDSFSSLVVYPYVKEIKTKIFTLELKEIMVNYIIEKTLDYIRSICSIWYY